MPLRDFERLEHYLVTHFRLSSCDAGQVSSIVFDLVTHRHSRTCTVGGNCVVVDFEEKNIYFRRASQKRSWPSRIG